jgi:pimeloyl-ACP methyl ester carboxylesterase
VTEATTTPEPSYRERSELAPVGDLQIAFEEFGDPNDPSVLLIMGLGMQMLGWDERFCEAIAARGYHVVRFDNRDVGLSSKVGGKVNLMAGIVGMTGSAAYDLNDMAADAIGLMDHLGIERAHLVGASMGAMIAQTVAATAPHRTLSLCSIMAGTGKRKITTLPRLGVLPVLFGSAPESREAFIETSVVTFDKIGSPDYPPDSDRIRERAARSYDRCFYPPGTARQLMAVLASGDRTDQLARIEAPAVVIHGCEDPLVPERAGRDTAEAIPGADYQPIEGMGHDLPEELWPELLRLIVANMRSATPA